jgi:hypothetical protein
MKISRNSHRNLEDKSESPKMWLQGLFELRGLGKEIWEGIDPDEYVRVLREDDNTLRNL